MIACRRILVTTLVGALCARATIAQELPSAGELEVQGATISTILIDVEDIFDTTRPEEDKRLYRWANNVHLNTRTSVIESILLFNEGDLLTEQILAESERLLRDQRFIADAWIETIEYDAESNSAVVSVRARDSWSLEPDIKLSRSGGENEYGIGFVEDNLFGLGKSMALSYSSDVDRDQRLFGYTDDNLFGSRKELAATVVDLSDGQQFAFRMGRPFYAFDTRWSVQSQVLNDKRIDSIYDLGETIDEFRHNTRFLTVHGGRSRGLVDGMTKRWLAGVSYEEDEFLPSPGFGDPLLLPEYRKLVYPWTAIHWIGDDFREVSELDDMGRTEDIALGLDLFARIGVASPDFGSDRRSWLFDLSAERGWEPSGPGSLFQFAASAETRYEHGDFRNTVVAISGRYLVRNFGDELFLAGLRTVFSNALDAENQILLGGDSGLRGFPLRYQSGEKSILLTLEQRFYTDWYPFQLIRVGYAFFFDAGRVWDNDPRNTPNLGTLYNIGMGLRLTSPRSSGRSVVHLDLAFPINAPGDIDDIQIVVEKRSSF